MLKINRTTEGSFINIALEGRLDTTTAPQLDEVIKTELEGIETLVFDFEKLDYISSAGLRVLLQVQKIMSKNGGMIIRNVRPEIMEVFDITGFSDILTIE